MGDDKSRDYEFDVQENNHLWLVDICTEYISIFHQIFKAFSPVADTCGGGGGAGGKWLQSRPQCWLQQRSFICKQ